MRVEEQFEVACSVERAYAMLNDVGEIGLCIAGVQEVKVIDDTRSRWRVEQRFGMIARTFNFDAHITAREPSRLVAFAAEAQEVAIKGHVALDALDATRARCRIEMDIDVSGPLAPLVEIFAKGPQQALIRQTLANLRARLDAASREPEAAPVARVLGV